MTGVVCGAGGGAATMADTAAPHSLQNRSSGPIFAPHFGHFDSGAEGVTTGLAAAGAVAGNRVPHCMQKPSFASARAPHFEHDRFPADGGMDETGAEAAAGGALTGAAGAGGRAGSAGDFPRRMLATSMIAPMTTKAMAASVWRFPNRLIRRN